MKKIVISIIALVCLWIGIWGITEVVFSYEETTNIEDTYDYEVTDEDIACWYMDYIGMSDEPIYIEVESSGDEDEYIHVYYYYVSEDYTETWLGGSHIINRDYYLDLMFS